MAVGVGLPALGELAPADRLALAIVAVSLPAAQAFLVRAWRRRPAGLPAWPLIPLSGVLFWLLREKTYRGDGLLKLELFATQDPADRSVCLERAAGLAGRLHPDAVAAAPGPGT